MTGFEAIKRARELGLNRITHKDGMSFSVKNDDSIAVAWLFGDDWEVPEKSVTVTRSQVVEAYRRARQMHALQCDICDELVTQLGLE